MYDLLSNYFSGYGNVFLRNLSYVTSGMMRAGRASVWAIAWELNHETKQTFKANEKRVNRYLQDEDFQINDALYGFCSIQKKKFWLQMYIKNDFL